MDLQEFKLNKPKFVEEAKKCNDKFEFEKVAQKHKIRFAPDRFESAYAYFCGASEGELSEDALSGVAGGTGGSMMDIDAIDIAGTTIVN